MTDFDWAIYFKNVLSDFRELKEQYPFSYLTLFPTIEPEPAVIRVVAANKDLIEMARAVESDFIKAYSKELRVVIPQNYRETGCKVYGGNWINPRLFKDRDIHFNDQEQLQAYGYELCVGTPESHSLMKNVILENVKTAENMLIAYERVMTGTSEQLQLVSYSHGKEGREQFLSNKHKYMPKE